MHWSANYLGVPWVAGESDCWAFFRQVQAERFGRLVPAVPDYAGDIRQAAHLLSHHDERQRWQPTETPREGDGALMGKGRRPTHVGLYVSVGAGAILHCDSSGSVLESVSSLRLNGWNLFGYYTPCN